ncbi:MAG: hypothetical protein OEW06_09895 [Gemmatimonadota bacterium]|nr:hypothetical protein [Gemmatimonadota bacterium]
MTRGRKWAASRGGPRDQRSWGLALLLGAMQACGDATGPALFQADIDLAVVAPLAGGGSHVVGQRVDGSGVVDLTPDATFVHDPAWDPHGVHLAYAEGRWPETTLRVLDGAGDRVLVDSGQAPRWSPDGARVAFLRDGRVRTVALDGGGETAVSPANSHCGPPTWSPTATRLATYCDVPLAGLALMVGDVNGAAVNMVLRSEVYDWVAPAWSPREDEIALAQTQVAGSPTSRDYDHAVVVVRPDGTEIARIATDGWAGDPAWSPVGRRLTFTVASSAVPLWSSNTTGALVVHDLALDQHQVVPMPPDVAVTRGPPAWSPAGNAVAFTVIHHGQPRVCIVAFGEGGGISLAGSLVAESPAWRPR